MLLYYELQLATKRQNCDITSSWRSQSSTTRLEHVLPCTSLAKQWHTNHSSAAPLPNNTEQHSQTFRDRKRDITVMKDNLTATKCQTCFIQKCAKLYTITVTASVFTAQCYACAVYAMALCPSVRLSVCMSVTSRCSTKTDKRRITQTTPHDSPGSLVFLRQRCPRNSTGITPCGGAKCR